MNKDDIQKCLRMLGDELLKRNVTGEILLVGEAVMLLEVGNQEITKGIDAYFEGNAAVIREAVIVIADREDLPADWLNDAVKGFFMHKYQIGNGQNILACASTCHL